MLRAALSPAHCLPAWLPAWAAALGLFLAVGCSGPRGSASISDGHPNVNLPTLGGLQLWADVAWADGWRIQRHVWTRHHRLLDPANIRRAWGSEAQCAARLERLAPPAAGREGELVILLHGLGRTRHSLRALRRALEGQGQRVAALSYPSTRACLEEHAEALGHVLDGLHGVQRVSFVTHSLGGRLVLRMIERGGAWEPRIEIGRIVQIAPPNRGSRLAAQVRVLPPLRWLLGPALDDLALSATPRPQGLTLGVLAGVRGSPRGWNPLLRGDDDGVVALAETRPEAPHEFRSVRGVHTFLMNDSAVIDATANFLATGNFGP